MADNLLLEPIEYKIDETPRGVWRRFMYPNGELFEEFTSHRRLLGLPLVHLTRGKCPETGRRVTAKGIIAIGRFAIGIIAIGQVAAGVFVLGQVALGLIIGIGQAFTGVVGIGQAGLAVLFGAGQFVAAHIVVAQFGYGHYVLAQIGFGDHIWDMNGADPAARQFFGQFLP